MENKKHFKLYKSGKKWIVATITTIAISTGVVFSENVLADTQQPQSTGQVQKINNPTNDQTYDHQDKGNYGYLDQANFNDDQLQVTGWQATNQSLDEQNRFVIAYDSTTNKELGRSKIINNVTRPDVAKVHNVYNAANSGYNSNIKLNTKNMQDENDSIQVVSRYSNTQTGERQHTDWWSQPIAIDKSNYGSLDQFQVQNGQLSVAGWHATNGSINRDHHFLILFDQTADHEISRQEVKKVARPDVIRVYPNIMNADNSGFKAIFNVANLDPNHQYQILSRYSNAANGEGSYVTEWFAPRRIAPVNRVNEGWLDSFNISEPGQLTVAGWHASDLSNVASNRFIIIFDRTANRQVASMKINGIARPDVAKAYPHVLNAENAGFNVTFNLNSLQPGHQYSVVSRYSADPNGNGNDGQHIDFWSSPVTLNQTASYVDQVKMTDQGLHVQGWMASDNSLVQQNPYLIVLFNGKEITRQKLSLTGRPDVGRVYPEMYGSAKSGFSTDIKLSTDQLNKLVNGNLQILLRFSTATDGNPYPNQGVTDQLSSNYSTNMGNANISLNGNNINIKGWHEAIGENSRPYQYLIVVGLDGHEFYRVKLDNTNSNLNSSNTSWLNNNKSSFAATLPVSAAMNHRGIKVIHRYTDDANGNGNYLDFWSPQIDINDGFQSLNGGTVYYDPVSGQLATGWRTINGNRYYFSDGYECQPDPDDLWVYNDQLHGQMYTGINWVDGHCYNFGNDGIARALPQNDGWSWPFPQSGEGWHYQGQKFGYTSNIRKNGYHDGLDFGTQDHPGSAVHAVHGGRVLDVNTVRDNNGQIMWWFTTIWDGRFLYVYQEAFSNRNKITVKPNDIIYAGQVIGYRDKDHLHLGINTSPNYGVDLKNSFVPSWSDSSKATGHGEWIDPEWAIMNRI